MIEQKVENEAKEIAKSQDWESATKFPWSEKIHNILKNVFNLTKFRPLQLSVINATLSGNDVMVIMPTGGGKSLCYQLPALANTPNKGKFGYNVRQSKCITKLPWGVILSYFVQKQKLVRLSTMDLNFPTSQYLPIHSALLGSAYLFL